MKISIAFCAAAVLISFVLWQTVEGVLEENHIIESAQAVFLAFAAALHWTRMRSAVVPAAYSFHATLAILMVSVLLREVDIHEFGTSAYLELLEWTLRLLAVTLWVILGVHLLRCRNVLLENWRGLAFSPCSRFVWLGIVLYGISWFFDKEKFPLTLDTSMFFEETLQLCATLLFLLGALLARGIERPRPPLKPA